MEAVLFFVIVLFVTILIGLPIGFGVGLTAVAMMYFLDMNNMMMIARRLITGVDIYTLLAIPFFMLAGEIMNRSGIVEDLLHFSRALVGRVVGGLAHVNVLMSMLFAGLSGSSVADTSAIGSIMIPMMNKEGYDKPFSVAITCASSLIGVIIPPSIPMIIIGAIAQISIVRLFLGGAIPGIMFGLALMGLSYVYAKKRGYPVGTGASLREFVAVSRKTVWALILPLIVLGGILSGLFTATEASALAAVYAMIVARVIYKLEWQRYAAILRKTAINTGIVMLICGTAMALTWYLATAQVPQQMTRFMIGFTDNRYVFLLLLNIMLFVVGAVIDLTPALFLLVPILLPVSTHFGLDPVHFGVIMVANLSVGLVTPPVGTVLYVGTTIGKIALHELVRELLPIYLMLFLVVLMITYLTPIVLWLPSLF